MRLPASVAFFGRLFPASGLLLLGLGIWSGSEADVLLRSIVVGVGLLMALFGVGLLLGDNTSRVMLLWISGLSFLATIWQFGALMNRVGFGWLADGLSFRELIGPVQFAFSMAALMFLSGPKALAYCRAGKQETGASSPSP